MQSKAAAQASMTYIVDCLWARVATLDQGRPHHVIEDVIKPARSCNAGLVASAVVRLHSTALFL